MLRCLIFSTPYYVACPSLPDVMQLNVLYIGSCYAVWSCLHDATLPGFLYIMPCYVANEFNDLISAPTFILETTSFSRLASAASLVTHFWFQNPHPLGMVLVKAISRYSPGMHHTRSDLWKWGGKRKCNLHFFPPPSLLGVPLYNMI